MELDVDEGGFGPGLTGTVHSSEGVWPKYKHLQNPNNVRKEPLDRSKQKEQPDVRQRRPRLGSAVLAAASGSVSKHSASAISRLMYAKTRLRCSDVPCKKSHKGG